MPRPPSPLYFFITCFFLYKVARFKLGIYYERHAMLMWLAELAGVGFFFYEIADGNRTEQNRPERPRSSPNPKCLFFFLGEEGFFFFFVRIWVIAMLCHACMHDRSAAGVITHTRTYTHGLPTS
ncbi:hypothetical protein F4809DRAFT_601630 [Biscogniauxia mediterranea]|nr:hypothetical protein F4809DRAFT_601630 [Biscogniauxia mediterranea]